MLLAGKRVVITGASRGIGRAIALGCARHGADVMLGHSGRSSADDILTLRHQIEVLGRKVADQAGDIGDPDTGAALIAMAVEQLGGVDVFISNAGICPFHAFLDMPQETYYRTVNTNLNGAYFAVQAAARQMQQQGEGGAIIAVSSISALVGGGMQTHYTPTKAGLLSLMQSCAIALGPLGIRCNALLPGTIETDINREDLADPHKRSTMQNRIPLGRLGQPEDLVGPAVFLASDLARYVTGASLLVDGGMYVNLQ
ncbi:L-rhamnose-1-dehydrogenase [Aquitalea magnusonii]|uniref:L-rhamnose 1-dehydrogenase (NAD(P)(+)) n=1 Tax=Aquitalea magnusonii TaxID=332411 RepID=A0A3G9GE39_9NEIS|nr:SDR family NAD(P)-dependent oxidoreductase [Aquitalea magnusonii]BBF84362.1 L-rhamnose-1-dehydrogenase [Aquitalea magnusonii]